MKYVGMCTDGGWAMCSKNSSIATRVHEVSANASWTHCNLRREVLGSKTVSDELKSVLNIS
jgi:hypothetical protein